MASASKKSFIFLFIAILCAGGAWWFYNYGNPFETFFPKDGGKTAATSPATGSVPPVTSGGQVAPLPVITPPQTNTGTVGGTTSTADSGAGQGQTDTADAAAGQGQTDAAGAAAGQPENQPGTEQPGEEAGPGADSSADSSTDAVSPENSGDAAKNQTADSGSEPVVSQKGEGGEKHEVLFNEATPVKTGDNLVRGEVDPGTVSIDTKKMFADDPTAERGPEDGVVGMGFINSLAGFLVDNYWPAGTHPMAKGHGISTADVKLANLKYGTQLEGFSVGRSIPDMGRQRVLQYMLKPSMVKGLYGLYDDRFMNALTREAATRKKNFGGEERILTRAETAQMFKLYSKQSRAYAGVVRSYLSDGENPARVHTYIRAEQAADEAYVRYQQAVESGENVKTLAREYQAAVINREQAKNNVAAALRRGGNTGGLDAGTLVYVAMWLNRRPVGDEDALEALVGILNDCAARMDEEGDKLSR